MSIQIGLGLMCLVVVGLHGVYDVFRKSGSTEELEPGPGGEGLTRRLVLITVDDLSEQDVKSMPYDLLWLRDMADRWGYLKTSLASTERLMLSVLTGGEYGPFLKESKPLRGRLVDHLNYGFFSWPGATSHFNSTSGILTEGTSYDPVESLGELWRGSKNDAVLEDRLLRDKVLFMFRLRRNEKDPYNLRPIEEDVKLLYRLIENRYSWEGTTFLVTTGVSTMGWYPREGRGVFFLWGGGVAKSGSKETTTGMATEDLAPLVSALLGLPFPPNSVGILREDLLAADRRRLVSVLARHALQLSSLALSTAHRHSVRFFSDSGIAREPLSLSKAKSFKEELIDTLATGRDRESYKIAVEFLRAARASVEFHRVAPLYVISALVASVGLGVCLLCVLTALSSHIPREGVSLKKAFLQTFTGRYDGSPNRICNCLNFTTTASILSVFFLVLVECATKGRSFVYYLYSLTPLLISLSVFWKFRLTDLSNWTFKSVPALFAFCFLFLLVTELLYRCIANQYLAFLGIMIIFLLSLLKRIDYGVLVAWCTSTLLVAIAFCSHYNFVSSELLINSSGLGCVLGSLALTYRVLGNSRDYVLGLGGCFLLCMAVLTLDAGRFFLSSRGYDSPVIRAASWSLLVAAPLFPLLGSTRAENRLVLTTIYLCVPTVLMAERCEPLVFAALFCHASCWTLMRPRPLESPPQGGRPINPEQAIHVLVFATYIVTSFSLSSSENNRGDWIGRFFDGESFVFNAILVLYKISLPLFVILSNFEASNAFAGVDRLKNYSLLSLVLTTLTVRAFFGVDHYSVSSLFVGLAAYVLIYLFLFAQNIAQFYMSYDPVMELIESARNKKIQREL